MTEWKERERKQLKLFMRNQRRKTKERAGTSGSKSSVAFIMIITGVISRKMKILKTDKLYT